jgi:N-glycosidase YbiA
MSTLRSSAEKFGDWSKVFFRSTNMISSFTGKYNFLSNYYSSPDTISAQHLFLAWGAKNIKDRIRILDCKSWLGARSIANSVESKSWWNEPNFQDGVMYIVLAGYKFSQLFPDLRRLLLDTRNEEIVYGNKTDKYWGMVLHAGEWEGENRLGKILMKVRQELKGKTQTRVVGGVGTKSEA